jgi:ribokinase
MTMGEDRVRICILGSINMDLVVRAPRLPGAGETVLGGPFEASPGGKGANQAVSAARMGASVSMLGRVGDDGYGRAMLATLRESGVDVSAVDSLTGEATGIALITVSAEGENTIVVAPGANGAITPADIDAARSAINGADVLLVQLEVPTPAVLRAAQIARESGVTVILNAAPGAALPEELVLGTDVLVVNRTEGAIVAGLGASTRCEAVLARLAALGPGTVVMTLGAEGSLHVRGSGAVHPTEAFAVEPVDTVGAGDAFCGALAVRWAEHQVGGASFDEMTMLDIMAWASAAGALAATRRGAIPSLPTRREVAAVLKGRAR